jgi:hypothetical protein
MFLDLGVLFRRARECLEKLDSGSQRWDFATTRSAGAGRPLRCQDCRADTWSTSDGRDSHHAVI